MFDSTVGWFYSMKVKYNIPARLYLMTRIVLLRTIFAKFSDSMGKPLKPLLAEHTFTFGQSVICYIQPHNWRLDTCFVHAVVNLMALPISFHVCRFYEVKDNRHAEAFWNHESLADEESLPLGERAAQKKSHHSKDVVKHGQGGSREISFKPRSSAKYKEYDDDEQPRPADKRRGVESLKLPGTGGRGRGRGRGRGGGSFRGRGGRGGGSRGRGGGGFRGRGRGRGH